jgi:hypothetical protein
MVPDVLNGNVTASSAGERFLLAIVISWFAGSLLTSIIDRYSMEARRSQAIRTLVAARRVGPAGEDPRVEPIPLEMPR